MTPRRITATESEFGAAVIDGEGSWVPLNDWSNSLLTENIPSPYAGVKDRLRNGGRFYMDVGYHPEYATPEDDSILGAIANELAGERIAFATMQAIVKQRQLAGFSLNKRVADHKGMTWGYHENYSCSRQAYQSAGFLTAVAVHAATRNIFTGAGGLLPDGSFALAQKAPHLTRSIDGSTTNGTKPLICIREEAHADKERFARLQIVGGDPNMSPWATRLKLGTTSLVMDVMEHGYRLDHIFPSRDKLHWVARQVATDLTLRQTVQLENGDTIRPLEIQLEFMKAAKKLSLEVELGPEKTWVLEEWERALDDAETDPGRLRNRADWPQRHHVLRRHQEKYGDDPEAPSMFDADYRWDAIDPRGTGMILRQTLWQQWMPDEALIKERMTTPPQTTRAAVRGRFVDYALRKSNPNTFTVDWAALVTPAQSRISLPDPFENDCPQLNRIISLNAA